MAGFYRDLRSSVSLLLAEGHPQADQYPIAMVWSEERIAKRRLNHHLAQHMVLWHSAAAAIIGGKQKSFQKQIKGLQDGD